MTSYSIDNEFIKVQQRNCNTNVTLSGVEVLQSLMDLNNTINSAFYLKDFKWQLNLLYSVIDLANGATSLAICLLYSNASD